MPSYSTRSLFGMLGVMGASAGAGHHNETLAVEHDGRA